MARIPTIGTKIKLDGDKAVVQDLKRVGNTADSALSRVDRKFGKADRRAKGFELRLGRMLGKMTQIGKRAGALSFLAGAGGVGGPAAVAGAGTAATAATVATYENRVLKLEQAVNKVGVAFERLAPAVATLEGFGVPLKDAISGFEELNSKITDAVVFGKKAAKEPFQQLGIDETDLVKNAEEIQNFKESLKGARIEAQKLEQLKGAPLRKLAQYYARPGADLEDLQRLIDTQNLRSRVQQDLAQAQGRVKELENNAPRPELRSPTRVLDIISRRARAQGRGPRTSNALNDLLGESSGDIARAVFASEYRRRQVLQRARETGAVPTRRDLIVARGYRKDENEAQQAATGVWQTFGKALAPGFGTFLERLSNLVKNNPKAIEKFAQSTASFVNGSLNDLLTVIVKGPEDVPENSWVRQAYELIQGMGEAADTANKKFDQFLSNLSKGAEGAGKFIDELQELTGLGDDNGQNGGTDKGGFFGFGLNTGLAPDKKSGRSFGSGQPDPDMSSAPLAWANPLNWGEIAVEQMRKRGSLPVASLLGTGSAKVPPMLQWATPDQGEHLDFRRKISGGSLPKSAGRTGDTSGQQGQQADMGTLNIQVDGEDAAKVQGLRSELKRLKREMRKLENARSASTPGFAD